MTAGRPTKKTPSVIRKLSAAFRNGFTIVEACQYSGITSETYYQWIKQDPALSDKLQRAQDYPNLKSKEVVLTSINAGDVGSARWWLERKSKGEFSTRQEVTGKDGRPFNEPLDESKINQLDEILNENAEKPDKNPDQPAGGSPSKGPA